MVGVWGHRPSKSLKHSAIERIREKNINSRKEKQIRELLERKEPNQLFDSSMRVDCDFGAMTQRSADGHS